MILAVEVSCLRILCHIGKWRSSLHLGRRNDTPYLKCLIGSIHSCFANYFFKKSLNSFNSFFLASGRLLNSILSIAPSNAYKCTRQTCGYVSFSFKNACLAPDSISFSAESMPIAVNFFLVLYQYSSWMLILTCLSPFVILSKSDSMVRPISY